MNDQKKRERQDQFRKLDDWLIKLHREHPVRALGLAFGVAFVLAGLAWLLKVSLIWLVHLVMR